MTSEGAVLVIDQGLGDAYDYVTDLDRILREPEGEGSRQGELRRILSLMDVPSGNALRERIGEPPLLPERRRRIVLVTPWSTALMPSWRGDRRVPHADLSLYDFDWKNARDVELLITAAQEYNITSILPTVFLQEHDVAKVAHRLNLDWPAVNAVETTMDKAKFTKFIARLGFPAPVTHACETREEILSEIKWFQDNGMQCILKPDDLYGSLGVTYFAHSENPNVIEDRVDWHLSEIQRTGGHPKRGSIVQEFIKGSEFGGQVVVENGRLVALKLTRKYMTRLPYRKEEGHLVEPNDRERVEFAEELRPYVEGVLAGLQAMSPPGAKTGRVVYNFDVIKREGDGKPVFVDWSGARPGPRQMNLVIGASMGMNFNDEIWRFAIGGDASFDFPETRAAQALTAFPEGGIVIDAPSWDEIPPWVLLFKNPPQRGDFISPLRSLQSADQPVVVTVGRNLGEVWERTNGFLRDVVVKLDGGAGYMRYGREGPVVTSDYPSRGGQLSRRQLDPELLEWIKDLRDGPERGF